MVEHIYEVVGIVIAITVVVGLYALPVRMAKKRGRSAGGWFALSLFITPFWAAIALAVLGDSKEKVRDEIINKMQGEKESSINSSDMKTRTGFFPGLLTGFLLAALFILGVAHLMDSPSSSDSVEKEVEKEEKSPLTIFDQPVDVIKTASFQVQEVLSDGNAIAKSEDNSFSGYYTEPKVLLLADESNPYYDKQIVRVPNGKSAYRVGSYQYEPYYGSSSTLPVVRIMKK